jgi:hypothetical protein
MTTMHVAVDNVRSLRLFASMEQRVKTKVRTGLLSVNAVETVTRGMPDGNRSVREPEAAEEPYSAPAGFAMIRLVNCGSNSQ